VSQTLCVGSQKDIKPRGELPNVSLNSHLFTHFQGVTMDDCVMCANRFAARLAQDLEVSLLSINSVTRTLNQSDPSLNVKQVPVYLYGEAATSPARKTLPTVRSGEYEGLIDKLMQKDWAPDYGPADFVPSWGATAAGARKFLIAYNINLLGTKEQAHRLALNIREQGRSKETPGKFKHVQAIGWWLEEANLAQISINVTDTDVTPLHEVFEEGGCHD
jgi:glutamate formiminotransferase/formiminotetrahydrofolate cyclodeaminase